MSTQEVDGGHVDDKEKHEVGRESDRSSGVTSPALAETPFRPSYNYHHDRLTDTSEYSKIFHYNAHNPVNMSYYKEHLHTTSWTG
jgi:hypothetical protein